MKVDPARHREQPWRVHTLTPDFELLDVWSVPIEADPARGETFDRFLEIVWENGLEAGSTVVRALVRLRGLGSRPYMSLIQPFRKWFVYPAWTAHVARLWRDQRSPAKAMPR